MATLRSARQSGMSLIEMMIALVVFGIVLGMGIPAFQSSMRVNALHGAIDNIAGQIRLARESAIATNGSRAIHFCEDSLGTDYHVHLASGSITGWSLPNGVHYTLSPGTSTGTVLQASGRASRSMSLVLLNDRGQRDSITVELSGFVLAH